MHKLDKVIKQKEGELFWTAVYVLFFALSTYIVDRTDDFVFRDSLYRYGGLWSWITWFFNHWGGRVIPQGLLVILLQLPNIFFYAINAFAWTLLVLYAVKIIGGEQFLNSKRWMTALFICMVFILMPVSVLNKAVFWKCANVLYLWGSAAYLIAIYPFVNLIIHRQNKPSDRIFAVLAAIYASGFEQIAALMCGAMCLFIGYYIVMNKKSPEWYYVLVSVIAIVLTLVFCISPGNSVRIHAEVLGQLPKYDMYSLPDKLLWGIVYVITSAENEVIFLILLLSVSATYVLKNHRKKDDMIVYGAYLMCFYFVLCTIDKVALMNSGQENLLSKVFYLIRIDSVSFGYRAVDIIRTMVHMMMYVYLGCILTVIPAANGDDVEGTGTGTQLTTFITFFGGVATSMIMAFSPTVYASGARPRFIMYLMMICCLLQNFCIIYREHNDRNTQPEGNQV